MVGGVRGLPVLLLRHSVGRLSERERKLLRDERAGVRLDMRRIGAGS